ncbi:MAG TPA: iron uptake transporter permease EfeU [Actinomycetota bacterium]
MGAALLITLREGLEAALIISILLAYLRQLERTDRARLVWWGAALAAAFSLVVGTLVFAAAAEFEGTAEQLFEGLVSLTAVGVLTWMIFWMRKQGARLRSSLHERVDSALMSGGLGLAGLAFVVVAREGIETALFVFAAAKATAVSSGGAGEQLIGAGLGLAVAFAVGALLYRGAVTLNIRTFFKMTGGLILVVAAGLFAFAIHELQEAGVFPFLTAQAFDISRTLPDDSGVGGILRALIGYQANPTLLELVAWVCYLTTAAVFYFRPYQISAPQPAVAGVAQGGSDGGTR